MSSLEIIQCYIYLRCFQWESKHDLMQQKGSAQMLFKFVHFILYVQIKYMKILFSKFCAVFKSFLLKNITFVFIIWGKTVKPQRIFNISWIIIEKFNFLCKTFLDNQK